MNRSSRAERRPAAASRPLEGDVWKDLPEAVKYGDVCYQAERYADALDAYASALKSLPKKALTAELVARLHYRMSGCHLRRSNFRLALDQLDLARRALPRHLDQVRLAKVTSRRGHIMLEMGQYGRAERYLSWAKKLLSGTNEHEELAAIEINLGTTYARLGNSAEARQCFLNALATYRRIGDVGGEAKSLNNLGLQYKNACEWREAVRYLEEARTLFERIGHRQHLVTTHLNLGIVHFKLGKWELAEENLAAAEHLAREMGGRQPLVRIHLAQGNLQLRRRRWDESRSLYLEARQVSEEEGYRREAILAREFLGELHLEKGEFDLAAELLEAALAEAREVAPDGDLVNEILRRLAEARLGQGRSEEALGFAKESAASASRIGDRYEEAVALRVVGLAMMERGQREEGERLITMSLDALGEIGEAYQKGLTHLGYGRFLARAALESRSTPELERAAVQLQRAYGAFLDLDARIQAATAAAERTALEIQFHRFEEAVAYRAKARQVLPPGADADLEARLESLGEDLEDAFAERWSAGGDVLASLREMKRLFQGATDTEAVLEELIRLAVTRSGSSRGCVALAGDNGEVRVAAAYGWSRPEADALIRALGPTVGGALEENRPIWSNNALEDERFKTAAADARFQARSLVLFPLLLTDEKPGLLYVDKTEETFEGSYHQGELHLLTILANLAALSIMERRNLRLARENEELRARIALGEGEHRFVTAHPALKETLRLAGKVANSPVSILIEGETGTGKGLLVQVIHEASNRREKPFVQINCAALPEPLLESELFGHVKGAFTGATYNKVGLFKEAENGTLFLDEVDKTSLAVQAKLLHVLDSKEVRPVGSVKPYRVDTRVVCATNTNLREKIKAGEFLEDLYYRLNDFILTVPPLRERREDIPLLIEYFLKKFSQQYGRPEVKLSPEVRRVLLDHPWPGNVRELEKTIRRLVVLADEELPVGMDLLPLEIQNDPGPVAAGTTLREEVSRTERRVIADALRASGWNKSQAARTLKVSYPCLLKKIKEHRLAPPRS